MNTRRIAEGRAYRLSATLVAVMLALGACGGGTSDESSVNGATPSEVIEEEAAATETAGDVAAPVEAAPAQDDLASVPVVEPTAEIEIGSIADMRGMALAPDGTHVAVSGGGTFTDIDAYLRVFDTAVGELVADIPLDETPEPGNIYWTADNQLVGVDINSSDLTVTIWDGTSFAWVDTYIAESISCLTGVHAFDPTAGALFAYDDFSGELTFCRRQIDTDTLTTAQPIGEESIGPLMLRPDGSELIAEVYDRDADELMVVRFDPTTLEVLGETPIDGRESLEGVGIDQHLLRGDDNTFTLQPSGVLLWNNLDRARFSPDGTTLWALNRRDDVEMLFDITSGEPIGQFPVGWGEGYHAWSSDGSVLAIPQGPSFIQIFRP